MPRGSGEARYLPREFDDAPLEPREEEEVASALLQVLQVGHCGKP